MLRNIGYLFLISLYFIFFPNWIFAEEIKNFSVSAKIQSDGSVNITEKISYDFGSLDRHGIFRTIPFVKTNQDGKKFRLEFEEFSVADGEGSPYQFAKSTEGTDIKLKIGDPDRTITGVHEYDVSYVVRGALTYFSDHDELYWNVTGNGWEVPVESADISITLPNKEKIKFACYTGPAGSTNTSCVTEPGGVRSTGMLAPGEGLTVVAGFPKNTVAELNPEPYVPFPETFWGKIITAVIAGFLALLALSWYLLLPGYIIIRWWLKGRDPAPPQGEAHVWFAVPKTKSLRQLTPGEVGTLVDEQADMRDITASIVDLARRGAMKIVEKTKGDFTFTKTSVIEMQPHEKMLYEGLFEDKESVRVKDGNFVTLVSRIQNTLYDTVVKEGFFDTNPQKTRMIYYVIAGIALFTFNLPLALIAGIFGHNMPRKTIYGSDLAAQARALRNFLVSQKEQLAFQAKNQLFFEKMLPYAVAFGVEKIWAARFADIAMSQPDWYQGYGRSQFNSVLFTNSLASSLSGFSAAATPTRSSSGFSSGFSGGSSGGGGGGGGGGSW